jgi:signal transduction histidine kinase
MTSTGGRVREAARCHPYAADAVLAAALLGIALMIGHHMDAAKAGSVPASPLSLRSVALETVIFCALVFRTVRPELVLSATTAGAVLVMTLDGGGSAVALAVGLAVLTVAYKTDRRTSVLVALTVGPLLVVGASWRNGGWLEPDNLSMLGWTGFAAAVGDATRSKHAYLQAVEERARRAEHTREEEARRRVVEERMRIARELHDVVAHHIAVIHVQAGVVGHLLADQPDAAREALGHVRRSSRAVLDELGGLLDVLRQPDEPLTPTDPAPSLDRLGSLIESFAASGLQVDWAVSGTPQAVPAAVDLVAYRLVQEGLTNAHKHGTGSVTLDVAFKGGNVAIDIVNPSACVELGLAVNGHGLVGMRERARAVGGSVLAAGQSDGTWRVSARLPLHQVQPLPAIP